MDSFPSTTLATNSSWQANDQVHRSLLSYYNQAGYANLARRMNECSTFSTTGAYCRVRWCPVCSPRLLYGRSQRVASTLHGFKTIWPGASLHQVTLNAPDSPLGT